MRSRVAAAYIYNRGRKPVGNVFLWEKKVGGSGKGIHRRAAVGNDNDIVEGKVGWLSHRKEP